MMRFLTIALCLFFAQEAMSSDLHKHFEIDMVSIEAEFNPINKVIQLLEEGVPAPSSNVFEIPVDSTTTDFFPIYGLPTFWATFIPSCAASCCTFNPVAGSCVGLVSAASIYHFTGDRKEASSALAGCAFAQLPVIVGLGSYYAFLINGF